ncbi:hypothetical protein TTHERM_00715990 (macronuclear) [Tetrahymena thermophila SB210]|uniref:Uncharacterized protein n=1 Tax=Tetrahymena thermophila (strain SB210) TaxID=312017 RepID=I7MFT8_TETTS|nr:hypothetical protein TTHERM_00715990 [Tetrahymena thermophila SB210]EAR84293.2 hypothetical protein TTHERM_00715990 [Tetrahymena thermophila SB210]|eukprot:XP_001031956.2 hypothetical protein TTHERM_00715990 [Tetrahymena thermophila SB210]
MSNKTQQQNKVHVKKGEQPSDTVSCIKWLNSTLFFVSTWASEIIGYQVEEMEVNRVYYKKLQHLAILNIEIKQTQNSVLIWYANEIGELFQISTNEDDPISYLMAEYPIIFIQNIQMGLLSVDMAGYIRINKTIINDQITKPSNTNQAQKIKLTKYCGLQLNYDNQNQSLIGCSVDFPFILLYGMSQNIYLIDLQQNVFDLIEHPFKQVYVSCGQVKKNSLLNGEIILGTFDGLICRIKFEKFGDDFFLWDKDDTKNNLLHFTKREIQILKNYNQQSQSVSSQRQNLPNSLNVYTFSVNSIQVLPQNSKGKRNFISCGGDGKVILSKKPYSQFIENYILQSVSCISLNSQATLLVIAVGYDWHQGNKPQNYCPFIEIIKLNNNFNN